MTLAVNAWRGGILLQVQRRIDVVRKGDKHTLWTASVPARRVRGIAAVGYNVGRQRHVSTRSDAEQTLQDAQSDPTMQALLQEGIQEDMARRVMTAFPHFRSPSRAQTLLWRALNRPMDVLLRAHTGSGKSLATLIGLLNRMEEGLKTKLKEEGVRSIRTRSIIVVPTRPLALQYAYWAHRLLAPDLLDSFDFIISVTANYTETDDFLMGKKDDDGAYIRIMTASALGQIIRQARVDWRKEGPRVDELLNLRNLESLVLDEADFMFDLPGRYPSEKDFLRRKKHPPPIVDAIKHIMERRQTFSYREPRIRFNDGTPAPKTPFRGKRIDRRQNVMLAAKYFETDPLQLVVLGASANSVLRRYLGQRAGWLRTDSTDPVTGKETAQWIDLTNLTSSERELKQDQQDGPSEGENTPQNGIRLSQVPREIVHQCVVIDEPVGESDQGKKSNTESDDVPLDQVWRNLRADRRLRDIKRVEQDTPGEKSSSGLQIVPPRTTMGLGTLDLAEKTDGPSLLCLAYLFASMAVQKGLVIIGDGESTIKMISVLRSLGVPAVNTDEDNTKLFSHSAGEKEEKSESDDDNDNDDDDADSVLHVVKACNARGIDFAGGITHVFLLGFDVVKDSVTYLHLAGRVSRLGSRTEEGHDRPPGNVITLLRGVERQYVEERMRDERALDASSGVSADAQEDAEQSKHIKSTEEAQMLGVCHALNITLTDVSPLSLTEKGPKETESVG